MNTEAQSAFSFFTINIPFFHKFLKVILNWIKNEDENDEIFAQKRVLWTCAATERFVKQDYANKGLQKEDNWP